MPQSLVLSILVLALAFCILQVQGSDGGAQDCCLTYSRKKIPANIVRSYRRQDISLGCAMPAILFSPRKRSQPELCADPKEAWVQNLMRRLDKPSAPRKPAQDCKKDKGAPKSGKKGKGSKGCKRQMSLTPVRAMTASGSLYLDTNPTLALGGANDAEDCCLSVTQRPIPVFLVRAYRYLLLEDGCRLSAVVFTTQRGHELCAPPDQPWVGRIIRRLKKNSARASLTLPSPASSLQAPAQDPSP
ncbi:hypothetical protein MG293_007771 [Ovis ammon polii]|uniref:C-C motif chemokine n=1 Tax=Ovis ammon polii TaxID=230172 RepID=A0AAD4UD25_OVIAM|nr:hypothetical protein MG293_007771 [Ovis ammon polii]KAI4573706.1 hypothetical protein MJT46_004946 [Ovis ammon polii x Ovis aries]